MYGYMHACGHAHCNILQLVFKQTARARMKQHFEGLFCYFAYWLAEQVLLAGVPEDRPVRGVAHRGGKLLLE